MTRISKPKISHLQRLKNKNNLMKGLQEILDANLPSGVRLVNDMNTAVLKAMLQVKNMYSNQNLIEEGYTHISICLDRSGSMKSIQDEIIGGLNNFIAEQQKLPGKLTVSLIQFDDIYEVVYNFQDGKSIQPITNEIFVPRGMTALNDSFYRMIVETKEHIDGMTSGKPERVLFLSLTDGLENASQKYSSAELKKLITQYESEFKWTFSYIGANQDAFGESITRGIVGKNAMNFTTDKEGMKKMFNKMTSSTSMYRSAVSVDAANLAYNLSDEDTKA